MNSKYEPFNRYEANVSWYITATSDFCYKDLRKLNPIDYNTTKREVEWYLESIEKAQKENAKYIYSVKRRLSVLVFIAILIVSLVIEKTFNTDPYWYLGAFVATAIFTPIVLVFVIWNNDSFEKWLKYIYRDMFFPPIQPNVERFLSEYHMRKVDYYNN